MKTNKKTIQSAMDARLSFLDELPSCRAGVQYRIAQEEEPVMKKKVSLGLVFAMVLVLFVALNFVTSRVSGLVVKDTLPSSSEELLRMLGTQAAVHFAFAAAFAGASAWLLDRKVSL